MNTIDEIIKRLKDLTPAQQDKMLTILKTWQQEKHRAYQRRETGTSVDVASEKRVVQTQMRDVSASGIYINTSGKFEMDERVKVVFTIPGYDKPFKINGTIVRVEQHGMAIKFLEITPYFESILNDAIWKGISRPDECK